jgi:hypothetical protein
LIDSAWLTEITLILLITLIALLVPVRITFLLRQCTAICVESVAVIIIIIIAVVAV